MDDALCHAMNTSMIPVCFAHGLVQMVLVEHVRKSGLNIDTFDSNDCKLY